MEWEFEDKMDDAVIFTNGNRDDGIACSRESYYTIMDFGKMHKFLTDNTDNYTRDEWVRLKNHFEGIAYLSPMNGLVASSIARFLATLDSSTII